MNQYEPHWLSHPRYHLLRNNELKNLESIIPRLFGYHLVHVGHPDFATSVDSSLILHRCRVSPEPCLEPGTVRADPAQLPFKSQCVDVLVLTHLLESVDNPKAVLREVYRVLLPYGHLVITGINPWSFAGIGARLRRCRRQKTARPLLTLEHVVDWLDLLDFKILEKHLFDGPMPTSWWGRQSYYLKSFFPGFMTGYLVLAVKKTEGMFPIRPRWSSEKKMRWVGGWVPTRRSGD